MSQTDNENQNGSSATANPEAGENNNGNGRRRFLLFALAVLVTCLLIAYGLYYFFHGRWYENTSDAYASGNIVEVTPQMPGTIVEIGADDNTLVKAGQTLIKFDPSDSRIALDQAEAALAKTVRQVRGLYANAGGQSAELATRRVALERAREDFERRRGLESTGAISKEELAHMQAALDSAERALTISTEQLTTTRALIDDTTITSHPEVKSAAAAVRKAYLDYARSTLQASVTGYVTERNAQVGQRVTPGLPLMALVPLDQIWVDANFKETQLMHMRIGQPVELESDLYGSDVTYHGHIASLGVGTGSAMSLLPAQNATGNWIKIVQRLPVRIALDPKELREHPLRLGLSMRAEVDMHDRSGPVLSESRSGTPVYSTDIYLHQLAEAENRITRIIKQNDGLAASVNKAP